MIEDEVSVSSGASSLVQIRQEWNPISFFCLRKNE